MKILITGATGYIGKNLMKDLLYEKFHIHALARSSSDISKINSRIKIFLYNGKINELINYFKKEKFDGVIHLATHFVATHVISDISKMVSANIQFGMEILEATYQSEVKWFINTGTFWQNYCCDNYNPANLYAATKEAFQTIAKYYTETSELIFTTIKLSDTFGPNDNRKKLINLWNTISKTGETVDFPMGEQLIDICYIDDVIYAFKILIKHLNTKESENFKNKIFAVSAKKRYTLKELAIRFQKATQRKLNINWGALPYRKREVMIPWDKGKKLPGWIPKYSFEEGVKEMISENLKNE